MTTLFIPGHMPLSIDVDFQGVYVATWKLKIELPKQTIEQREARARQLAKRDFETQERIWFMPETPYESYLQYHRELQGLAATTSLL